MNEKNTSQALALNFKGPTDDRFDFDPCVIDLKQVFSEKALRLIRRHGITFCIVFLLALWTTTTCGIAAHNARVDTEARLAGEYEAKIQAFYEEQAAALLADNAAKMNAQAQMEREADAIARVIGTMKTKRMKETMLWNILVRVDNPNYPGSVEEVIAQPQQWMFYLETNPIREDDRALALDQLALWHDGRYPAGLSSAFVYGEWSENDYVLRNSWDKNSSTLYWRMPE